MAEQFFDHHEEKPTGNTSRPFRDFESEWVELGEKFCVNSYSETEGIRKRKLEETEDSIEVAVKRRKLDKDHEVDTEEGLMITLRQSNPDKMRKLEERMVSTTYSPSGSTPSRRVHISSNNLSGSEVTPYLDNRSQDMRFMNIIETPLDEASLNMFPQCSNIDGLEGPVEPEYSPVEDFTGSNWGVNVRDTERYPLMEELGVLNDLVDSMRVDLLQSSMLLDYIKNYLKKSDKASMN